METTFLHLDNPFFQGEQPLRHVGANCRDADRNCQRRGKTCPDPSGACYSGHIHLHPYSPHGIHAAWMESNRVMARM